MKKLINLVPSWIYSTERSEIVVYTTKNNGKFEDRLEYSDGLTKVMEEEGFNNACKANKIYFRNLPNEETWIGVRTTRKIKKVTLFGKCINDEITINMIPVKKI